MSDARRLFSHGWYDRPKINHECYWVNFHRNRKRSAGCSATPHVVITPCLRARKQGRKPTGQIFGPPGIHRHEKRRQGG